MQRYYLISLLIIVIAIALLIIKFEREAGADNNLDKRSINGQGSNIGGRANSKISRRRLTGRDISVIAVMCAISVASRAAFVMLPNIKPMLAIIMITGMALGMQAGFLTGALSAFASNFMFGQGPWTPWQMIAYGIAGIIGGILVKFGIIDTSKRLPVSIIGGLVIFLIIGPILDTGTAFLILDEIGIGKSLAAVYIAGLPFNGVHGLATGVTLFILCKPLTEIIGRIKTKYGIME